MSRIQASRLTNESDLQQLANYATRVEQLNSHLARARKGKTWHDKQQQVIQAIFEKGYKRIFIRKGRKGGGTETLLYPAARIAGCFDKMACYIIGPQYNLQKEIVWQNNRIHKFIPPEWNAKLKESEGRVRLPNGSFIKVHGADNHKSLVGIEGDLFIFDELKDHDPRAYKNCYPNIASRDAIWIVCGAPPKNKSNFYYQLEQQIKDDPDWFFIHWSTWDNAVNLPGGAEWIQNEKDAYYRHGNWDEWETEWEARYVFGGKRTVLSGFRATGENPHVIPYDVLESLIIADKNKLKWFQVFDPGYATCFAIIFGCYNPYTSEIFILDEIYETNRARLSINDIWPRVVAKQEALLPGGALRWRRIVDSAAPGFPQEVRARWGKDIRFGLTVKDPDDEDKYFRVWNGALSTNRFRIADRCAHMIFEMENYLTEEDGKYPDEHNHTLDSFRYFLKAFNYTFNQKQDDIIYESDLKRGYTLEDDLSQAGTPKDDIMKSIDGDYGGLDDGGFDFTTGGGWTDFH